MTAQTLPHDQSIAARIHGLFGLVERHAREYASPEAPLSRQRHSSVPDEASVWTVPARCSNRTSWPGLPPPCCANPIRTWWHG